MREQERHSLPGDFEPYLISETVKSVALHFSKASYDLSMISIFKELQGMYKALMESHIPFDIIIDEDITEGRIKDYGLLILSNSPICSSDKFNTALISYVNDGGSIFATHATSLHDTGREKRENFWS